ncbi:single-stranded DNA-binding protein [Reichenbachiella ulvae]|uniref:Single-stranded DNA-binding protein n=1 Tax=Reichenbachiella ulvae TaxID=2980104 RepID=A0ABT3CTM6_9BACT|nr:single-stranded DNA-binding protein [Reichenbachiella ulvae]MCV9386941.1 single-stranded DNA-binding protein [Reichenbachiella ulvae]
MNTLKNHVQLIGRLGNDPELRNFDSGKQMTTFSLATNESYTNNQGEKVTDTQWHHVVAWGKKAQTINTYLKKGSEVAIQGKLVNRKYEKDGATKYVTEINLSEVLMLDKKND